MYTAQQLLAIASHFAIDGDLVQVKQLGEGFINDTFTVYTKGNSPSYVLQRKNKHIFTNVPAMMDNIVSVTSHLREKVVAAHGNPQHEVLTVIAATDGHPYYQDEAGEYWVMTLYIDGAVTHNRADSTELAYKGGLAIGRFQSQLADFAQDLYEVIPGFHNLGHRLQQWDEALARDRAGRRDLVAREIDWIESRREAMMRFQQLVDNGTLPKRVTHNDTKISNILFDQAGNVMCVIDLDTVMSSTSLNDYGDAIRSYANTGSEDDRDLDRVSLSLPMCEAYTRGYLLQRRSTLTDAELQNLALSARFITYEQVLRFLMDYIDGDTYYKTAYPDHNLVRARAQYALLQSMESHYDEMRHFVDCYSRNSTTPQ